ncbi:hypothetical protein V2J09_022744 [Rumex salicifolius]
MGLTLSCPLADYNDVESDLESIIVKSISLGDDQVKTAQRSISFNGRDSDPKIFKSLSSGKMVVEGSVSFKKGENETLISISPHSISIKDDILSRSSLETDFQSSSTVDLGSPKHNAAIKLQKVYKSFRTRRKLADCAVLVEQSWWKLLDFAELKHSSISFFDIEHHETAISRWSRAKTRAAKVGKGLSKNEKAQKLALQHWLEAIDPRHRYGHNLHFYYAKWLESHSREPFFYWLDIGEGKEVNLEKCPRSNLQQQCIKYLGPTERLAYEVCVEDGKLFYKQSGELLDTTMEPHEKWIFVLSTSKTLYVGKKQKGTFQHSSFLAGGATSAAGRLVVENGNLKVVWPHSGHYRPTPENFQDFISFLKENNVDLSDVKMDPVDVEEQSNASQRSSNHLRSNPSEVDLIQQIQSEEQRLNTEKLTEEKGITSVQKNVPSLLLPQQKLSPRVSKSIISTQLSKLLIPKSDLFRRMQHEHTRLSPLSQQVNTPSKGARSAELDVSDNEDEESKEEEIPEESILKRINSHKETKSYQLGKQLSCKWTSGVGPRISCVRDYPSELQFRALEQVNLSPRSCGQPKCVYSPLRVLKLSPKVTMLAKISDVVPNKTKCSPLGEITQDSS